MLRLNTRVNHGIA